MFFFLNFENFSCFILNLQTIENEGRLYDCDLLPFMELGSVAHKYYLLNVRLPVNERKKLNIGIGEINDMRLVVSLQTVTLMNKLLGCMSKTHSYVVGFV